MKARPFTNSTLDSKSVRFAFLLLCAAMVLIRADDGKTPANPDAPVITSIQPFAFAAGTTNRTTVKGKNLGDNVTFTFNGLHAEVSSKTAPGQENKAEKKDDKKKGDAEQSFDIEFRLPEDSPAGTNVALVAHGAKGATKPQPVFIVALGRFIEEQEPNGGFKEAQPIEVGKCLSGTFSQATDVDVFKVRVKVGDRLKAEVFSARITGTLDTSITIYNAAKTIIASNDDSVNVDPAVTFKATEEADYYVALTAVTDVPAKTTPPYLLQISTDP